MKNALQINCSLSNRNDWFTNKIDIGELLTPVIFHKEHIENKDPIQAVLNSTNLVCQTVDNIIKIYAPEVCGFNPFYDIKREVYALKLMEGEEIRTPHLIAYGLLECEYNFYYCIMERIHISPVNQFLFECSRDDIMKLGIELQKTLKVFQSLNIDKSNLSKSTQCFKDSVFVHGDLTGENVLYNGKDFAVIDFEDWQFAPAYAELPPIVFEMIYNYIDIAPLFLNIPSTELRERLSAGIDAHYKPSRFFEKYENKFN